MAASTAAASSPSDDDDVLEPGRRERVQDVLEDRPAADRRQELAAAEPRPGARRQDEPTVASPRRRSQPPTSGVAASARPLAHRRAGAAVALGDDLGQDRQRGLGRRAAAEVQPDRSAQPRQLVRR